MIFTWLEWNYQGRKIPGRYPENARKMPVRPEIVDFPTKQTRCVFRRLYDLVHYNRLKSIT